MDTSDPTIVFDSKVYVIIVWNLMKKTIFIGSQMIKKNRI